MDVRCARQSIIIGPNRFVLLAILLAIEHRSEASPGYARRIQPQATATSGTVENRLAAG